jgi:large subunit ribosomal protein L17
MLKNLASSLFLTERYVDPDLGEVAPKVAGRVVTTLEKAKEVRPLVEKCVTIARRSLKASNEAEQFATSAQRNSEQWKQWRTSEQWQKWNEAVAPTVAARRRVLQLLGDKEAMRIVFEEIAPRFEDRDGGYTRIVRLAKPRLGDAGTRAILEFVGTHDRVKQKSEKPEFAVEDDEQPAAPAAAEEEAQEQPEDAAAEDESARADAGASEESGEEEDEAKS